MAIPTRTARPGGLFVTTATYNRRRIFQVEANALLPIETIRYCRKEEKDRLHAFVVMPDQIHCQLTPEAITLERAIGLIKGDFSRRLGPKMPVWRRGFTDHRAQHRVMAF